MGIEPLLVESFDRAGAEGVVVRLGEVAERAIGSDALGADRGIHLFHDGVRHVRPDVGGAGSMGACVAVGREPGAERLACVVALRALDRSSCHAHTSCCGKYSTNMQWDCRTISGRVVYSRGLMIRENASLVSTSPGLLSGLCVCTIRRQV